MRSENAESENAESENAEMRSENAESENAEMRSENAESQTFCLFEEELEPKSAVDRIDKDQRPSRNPVQFEECIHDQELVRVRAAQPELAELPLRGALSLFEIDRHCAKTNGDQGVRDMYSKNTEGVTRGQSGRVRLACGLRAACVRLGCDLGVRLTWIVEE